MKKLLALFILLLIPLLSSCSDKRYSRQFWDMFDTVITVDGYFESEEEFNEVCKIIEEELVYYNKLLDTYNDAEFVNLKSINDSDGECIEISEDLYNFLTDFRKIHKMTDGVCSMSLGSVTGIWKEFIASPDSPLPAPEALADASEHCDIDTILLEADPYRITLLDPAVKIDAGAYAKGWVGDRLKETLLDKGYTDLIINMGGNVVALGSKNGSPWSIGIRSPEGSTYETVAVSDTSVVTSGAYERGREFEGDFYHHIISPDTLYPESKYFSVTVICESSATADALSTALFLLDRTEGFELLKKFPEASAMWIDLHGNYFKTGNFPK